MLSSSLRIDRHLRVTVLGVLYVHLGISPDDSKFCSRMEFLIMKCIIMEGNKRDKRICNAAKSGKMYGSSLLFAEYCMYSILRVRFGSGA